MPDIWAAKSAKDDENDATVVQARRWHSALYLSFLALGLLAGFIAFRVIDNDLPIAVLESLYDDEDSAWEILLCALYMAVLGMVAGEAGNVAWILMCRYQLGLSSGQVRASLEGRPIFSFILGPLHERLYAR